MKKAVWLLALSRQPPSSPAAATRTTGATTRRLLSAGNQVSGGGGGRTVVIKADPSGAPRFKPTPLIADAGELTIELDNRSPPSHDMAVKGPGGEIFGHTQRVKQGKASVTVDLKPAKCSYYSTIPGEQDAGAVGKLTVK